MQFALGQQTAALISMQQVVQVERQLASQYPASFLPDLAAGLDNLSGCHLAVAQPEMAVAVHRDCAPVGESPPGGAALR